MKNYRVTVNGVAYDVVVEEVGGAPVVSAPVTVAARTAFSATPSAVKTRLAADHASVLESIKARLPERFTSQNRHILRGLTVVISRWTQRDSLQI